MITNKKGLPQIVVDACNNDQYSAGKSDYSATTLLKPAMQVYLERKHPGEGEIDASDMLFAMYGTAVHKVIELAATEDDLIEERFFGIVNGKIISAQIDHYRDGVVSDWKLTGVYKIKKALEGDVEEWEQQLNIQAYLMTEAGHEVKELRIGAMARDWSKRDSLKEENYPSQIEYIKLKLWTRDEQIEFIEKRIDAMELRDAVSGAPEPCTSAERWQNPPSYALMKEGGKRAVRVLYDAQEAEEMLKEKGDGHYMVTREAPNTRCEGYCQVNKFCKFYQDTYAIDDNPFK